MFGRSELKVAVFLLSLTFLLSAGECLAQGGGKRQISPHKVNQFAGQIVVLKLEKHIGHRLDWKRRGQLRDKATGMSNTIDKANEEFASSIQRAFHLSRTHVDELNSQVLKGRLYGNTGLIEAKISRMLKRQLNKYEKKEIGRLVSQRDQVQKNARENMAREIQGTVGISYQDALSMVAPRKRGDSAGNNAAREQWRRRLQEK